MLLLHAYGMTGFFQCVHVTRANQILIDLELFLTSRSNTNIEAALRCNKNNTYLVPENQHFHRIQ